jgi:hypothetical protein
MCVPKPIEVGNTQIVDLFHIDMLILAIYHLGARYLFLSNQFFAVHYWEYIAKELVMPDCLC